MDAPLPAKLPSSGVSDGEALPHIADHLLTRRIGKGAYGEVWLAKNVIGGFHAAKVIYRKRFSDDRPFEREFEGICKFEPISRTHPGLVTILQVGENLAAGYFYYVMELADDARTGQKVDTANYMPRTLSHEMALGQRIPLDKALPISLSLASALGYLHRQRLIHRDIKPSNIIFVNGLAKFADIGLLTETGEGVSYVGSAGYMPPEGPGETTGDIYSLGKVFYGMFMGQPCKAFPEIPGDAEEFTSTPALRQINNIIVKACHHDPRQRFQTAEDLHEALVSVTETVQGKTPGPGATLRMDDATLRKSVGAPEPPAEDGEQRAKAYWPVLTALLAIILVATWAAFLANQSRKGDSSVSAAARDLVAPAATNLVAVLMDTTAEHGIYDEDNKRTGRSNAKELFAALRDILRPENMHEVPVGLDWARQDFVRSLHPHVVIIHRSVFYHPVAAALGFTYPPFNTHKEYLKFDLQYKILGDNKLRDFLDSIGAAELRTRFLVYSRGTDTNWLSLTFRQQWTKELETQYPELTGRVETMLVEGEKDGEKNGSFRDPKTRKDLRLAVRKIFGSS